jgi:hypothetical protein
MEAFLERPPSRKRTPERQLTPEYVAMEEEEDADWEEPMPEWRFDGEMSWEAFQARRPEFQAIVVFSEYQGTAFRCNDVKVMAFSLLHGVHGSMIDRQVALGHVVQSLDFPPPYNIYVVDDDGDRMRKVLESYPEIPEFECPEHPFSTAAIYRAFAVGDLDEPPPRVGTHRYAWPQSMSRIAFGGDPTNPHADCAKLRVVQYLAKYFFKLIDGKSEYLFRFPNVNVPGAVLHQSKPYMKKLFLDAMPTELIAVVTEDGKTKNVRWKRPQIVDFFSAHYSIMAERFDPERPNPGMTVCDDSRMLNTFRGLSKDQNGWIDCATMGIRKASPIIWLLHLYLTRCGGDLRSYVLFFLYLSAMARSPLNRLPVMIILTGAQKTMKTQDMHMFSTMFPRETRMKVTGNLINDLIGHSTASLGGALVVNIDEIQGFTTKQVTAVKELLTSSMMRERMLFNNPELVKNFIVAIFATSEKEKLETGSNTLFGRRDAQFNAWDWWRVVGDSESTESLNWYLQMWFRWNNTGDVDRTPIPKDEEVDYERMTAAEVKEYPGLCSSLYFRTACNKGPKLRFEEINPTNMETLVKQLDLAKKGTGKQRDGQPYLFDVLKHMTFLTPDGTGVLRNAWDLVKDDRIERLGICITQTILYEWVNTVGQLLRLAGTYAPIDELVGPILTGHWGGLVTDVMTVQVSDAGWPSKRTPFTVPQPVLEGEDPYGRCPLALNALRSLWSLTASTADRQRIAKLLGDNLSPTLLSWYGDAIGYLLLLDEEMSRPFDYKNYVVPETLWKATMKLGPCRMAKHWNSLIREDVCQPLAEQKRDGEFYYETISRLTRDDVDVPFATHIWKVRCVDARMIHAERTQGRGEGGSQQCTVHVVPCYAAIRREFLQHRVPGEEKAWTLFAPNTMVTASSDELAFCHSLRYHLDPWKVAEISARYFLSGEYAGFDDLVRKIFLETVREPAPNLAECLSFDAFRIHEARWRESWAIWDESGDVVDGTCPFGVKPNLFPFWPQGSIPL